MKKQIDLKNISNKPFLIHQSDCLWMVQSGVVDIFLVTIKSNEQISRRKYLFSISVGHYFFGVPPISKNENMAFLAVGRMDTSIQEYTWQTILQSQIALSFIENFENWISHFLKIINIEYSSQDFRTIPLESCMTFKQNEIILPSQFRWIQHASGKSQILHYSKLELEKTDSFFPVDSHVWFTIISEKAKFFSFTTEELLKQNIQFEILLKQFYQKVLPILSHIYELDKFFIKQKLNQRNQFDQDQIEASLYELFRIFNQSSFQTISLQKESDPLFITCDYVCQSLGIPLKPLVFKHEDHSFLDNLTTNAGIRYRKVCLPYQWWTSDCGPLLGFLNKTHEPVALIPTSSLHYDLIHVAQGTKERITSQNVDKLSSTGFTFYKSLPDKPLHFLDLIKFTLPNQISDFIWIILMGIGTGFLSLLLPIITAEFFNFVIPNSGKIYLLQLMSALLLVAISTACFELVKNFAILRFGAKVDNSLQAAVWDRLLELPTSFFKKFTIADLNMRVLGINQVIGLLTADSSVLSIVLNCIFSFPNFFLMLYYDSKLAMVAFLLLAFNLLVCGFVAYFKLIYQRNLLNNQGQVSSLGLEILQGLSKIRIAAAEIRSYARYLNQFAQLKKWYFKSELFTVFLNVFNSIFHVFISMAIFFTIAIYFQKSQLFIMTHPVISTGNFIAFNAAFGQFLFAVLNLTTITMSLLQIKSIYERSKPILEAVPEVTLDKIDPGIIRGEIEVSHVHFQYSSDTPLILKDISFKINPGEFVAFVGPSGSGKSTIFRLLLGFEQPQSGSIYFDQKDLTDLNIRLVRQQIGTVLQNGRIFAGDIFYNIVGASHLTLDDAWATAKMVGLDKDIEEMPMRMFTFLVEGAGTLSGGQRQRLMLARALAHKPRILLLDEATSALDNQTQDIILNTLKSLNTTRIVIAHRLNTIRQADSIFVVDQGEIVQQGTYQTLINVDGPFKSMAERQVL